MNQYQYSVDRVSQIVNDPNKYTSDNTVSISVKTIKIVKNLQYKLRNGKSGTIVKKCKSNNPNVAKENTDGSCDV